MSAFTFYERLVDMVKKLVRILTKLFCVFLVFIIISYVGIGFFGGFHLKSIPCAGGFRTMLYDEELENIKAVCDEELTEEQLAWIKFYLERDKDNDRIMTTKYVNSDGEEVKLQCKMNWYWSSNYEWSKL